LPKDSRRKFACQQMTGLRAGGVRKSMRGTATIHSGGLLPCCRPNLADQYRALFINLRRALRTSGYPVSVPDRQKEHIAFAIPQLPPEAAHLPPRQVLAVHAQETRCVWLQSLGLSA
jgi:hypothetical protein